MGFEEREGGSAQFREGGGEIRKGLRKACWEAQQKMQTHPLTAPALVHWCPVPLRFPLDCDEYCLHLLLNRRMCTYLHWKNKTMQWSKQAVLDQVIAERYISMFDCKRNETDGSDSWYSGTGNGWRPDCLGELHSFASYPTRDMLWHVGLCLRS